MKRTLVALIMLLGVFADLAHAQLTVSITDAVLSAGDPTGTGSTASPAVYNVNSSTLFRWNGAIWQGMSGVSVVADAAQLQATGTDPTGAPCPVFAGAINTSSKQTFGCVDGKWNAVNVSVSGVGTITTITIAGTAGQISVAGTCTITTTGTCTLSIPVGFALPGTINKLTLTQPATGATITITDGKTLAALNTLSFSGTDATVINFPNPASITNGDCMAWGKSGSTLSFTDAGAACGTGGGAVCNATQTLGVVTMSAATTPCTEWKLTLTANVTSFVAPTGLAVGIYAVLINNSGGYTVSATPSNMSGFPQGTLPTTGTILYLCQSDGTTCVGALSAGTAPWATYPTFTWSQLSTYAATCPSNVPMSTWLSDATVNTLGANVTVGSGSDLVQVTCFTSGGNWRVTSTTVAPGGITPHYDLDISFGDCINGTVVPLHWNTTGAPVIVCFGTSGWIVYQPGTTSTFTRDIIVPSGWNGTTGPTGSIMLTNPDPGVWSGTVLIGFALACQPSGSNLNSPSFNTASTATITVSNVAYTSAVGTTSTPILATGCVAGQAAVLEITIAWGTWNGSYINILRPNIIFAD